MGLVTISFLLLGGRLAYNHPIAYLVIGGIICTIVIFLQLISKSFLRDTTGAVIAQQAAAAFTWPGFIPLIVYLTVHDHQMTRYEQDKP